MTKDTDLQSDLSASGSTLQSAFCASLRSKKFFMIDVIPTEESQYLDGSNHCWCRETQQAIGPDGGIAQPEHCVTGRSCYRSAFETEA
ncbi:MAG TPA: hypothetical protein VLN44_05945 [Pyrinomonadaceae bacterium]|nr:hypothetical protein [Pyrinomonadaceae bacterium]